MSSAFDLATLSVPTEETIVNSLSDRIQREKYFTLVGSLLLSVNHNLDIEEELRAYEGQDFGDEESLMDPAHLFLYLMKVYHQLCQQHSSHSIIICGLRGSGKSSLLHDSLRFLSAAEPEQSQKLILSYHILHAINTTSTTKNPSSSRSSQLVKLFFDDKGKYAGAEFREYGQELGRVPMLAKGKSENNFNLFYNLLYGESATILEKLKLSQLREYEYLPLTKNSGIDYAREIKDFKEALLFLTGEDALIHWIYCVLAAILHIGSLVFTEAKEKSPKRKKEKVRVQVDNKEVLQTISNLLEFESPDILQKVLLSGKTLESAQNNRDTFSMICYSLLSSCLYKRINQCIGSCVDSQKMKSISIVDVVGICESNEKLGMDEFFINYCNEKLRQVFYEHLLEGSPVEFQDNTGCVQLSEAICELLQKENSDPSPDVATFVSRIDKVSKEYNFGEVVDGNELKVEHYIGSISYALHDWYPSLHHTNAIVIEKLAVVAMASSLLTREISSIDIESLQKRLCSSKFLGTLLNLVQSFQGTINHFIYCLRGHDSKDSNLELSKMLPQLKSHGIVELAEISKFVQQAEVTVEYCNSFPGGGKHKKKKKKRKSSGNPRKLFGEFAFGKPGKPTEDMQFEVPRRATNVAPDSPRRRSRSFKNRIRPKSRMLKPDEIQQPAQPIAKRKQHAFMKSSSSLSTRSLKVEYQTSPLCSARGFEELDFNEYVESSESSDDSLALSSDHLSDVSCGSSEDTLITTSDIIHLPPLKDTLRNHSIFTTRFEKLIRSEDEQYFLDRVENFCWKENSVAHIVDNVEILYELTRLKIQQRSTETIILDAPSTKEIASRRQKFLDVYKCGSLLRTLYQSENVSATLEEIASARRTSVYEGSLKRSSSEGNIGRIRQDSDSKRAPLSGSHGRVSKLKVGTQSPRFSDDESDEDDVGIGEMDEISDKLNWGEEVIWRENRKNSIHFNNDTIDDTVNQINYKNSIKPSPRKRKTMIDFTNASQTYSFQTYAQSHFRIPKKMEKLKKASSKYKTKLKKLTSAVKDPIDMSLLSIRSTELNELAVSNFKLILAYMYGKTDDSETDKDAIENPLITCAQNIIGLGLQKNSLRDEIYCQLIKQATNNLKEKFLLRVWELLAFCTGSFAPSAHFQKYLVKFFDNTAEEAGEIGAWASYCKDRLEKITELGKRFFVPTERELNAVQQRKPIIQEFFFLDGRQKKIPVYSSTTAMEALEFLLQMVGLKDGEGYMVYEHYVVSNLTTQYTEVMERSLLYSEVLCNSLSKFKELQATYPAEEFLLETSFLIKRKLFLSPRKMPTDPVEITLQFHQAITDIKRESLLVREHDALLLCAMELQAQMGDIEPTRIYNAKEMLPPNIRGSRTNSHWKREINQRHELLKGVSKEEAKKMYLQFCTQLPFYGFHLFPVKHHSKTWDMPYDVFIGVHVHGIFFLSAGKEVYYCFPFISVLTHTATPFTVQIGFDGDHNIELRTNKGDEIISLIIDYKYYHFSKQNEK